MEKKSKVLTALLILIVIASISITFFRTVIKQDYEIVNTEEE